MQKRVLTLLAVSLLGLALVSGCGSSEKKEASTPQNKVIKIGATAGPHADVVHAVADEAKKQGINVEVIEFSDYITPDKALAEGLEGEMSFEERMGCGFGACMGCSCETRYGAKRICKDGPVLERSEILW